MEERKVRKGWDDTPRINLEIPSELLPPPLYKDFRPYRKNKMNISFRNPGVKYPKCDVLPFEEL